MRGDREEQTGIKFGTGFPNLSKWESGLNTNLGEIKYTLLKNILYFYNYTYHGEYFIMYIMVNHYIAHLKPVYYYPSTILHLKINLL